MRLAPIILTLLVLVGADPVWAATNDSPDAANIQRLVTLLDTADTNRSAAAVGNVKSTNDIASVAPTNAATSNEMVNALDDAHKLAIGDRLSFRIVEDEEDPKPMVVTDSGEVEVPPFGRFPAENKTCRELAKNIKAALEKDYYYQATVIIAVDLMAKTRGRIYLTGALRSPGPQEILSDETLTLSKAILRSGGFADYADRKNVKITRKTGPNENDKQTFVINVGQILDSGKVEADVPLEPGDMILVPDRKIRF